MGKWKWFKDSEVVGLVPRIVDMLDVARSLAGFPIVITSPGRTIYENQSAKVLKIQNTLLARA